MDKCHTCFEDILGGQDYVFKLPTPLHSYHVPHHLDCVLEAEREACAQIAESALSPRLVASSIRSRNKKDMHSA